MDRLKLGSPRVSGHPSEIICGDPSCDPDPTKFDFHTSDLATGLGTTCSMEGESPGLTHKSVRTSRACDRCRRQKLKVGGSFTTPLIPDL